MLEVQLGQQVDDAVDLLAGPLHVTQQQDQVDVRVRPGITPCLRAVEPEPSEPVAQARAQPVRKFDENGLGLYLLDMPPELTAEDVR